MARIVLTTGHDLGYIGKRLGKFALLDVASALSVSDGVVEELSRKLGHARKAGTKLLAKALNIVVKAGALGPMIWLETVLKDVSKWVADTLALDALGHLLRAPRVIATCDQMIQAAGYTVALAQRAGSAAEGVADHHAHARHWIPKAAKITFVAVPITWMTGIPVGTIALGVLVAVALWLAADYLDSYPVGFQTGILQAVQTEFATP